MPRCADACPTEAIKFGEESEFAAEIAKAEVLKPELGHKPRVYYLNMPKKFIAGTVYDPVGEGDHRRGHLHADRRQGRDTRPPPPTASATSGSAAWPTAPPTS